MLSAWYPSLIKSSAETLRVSRTIWTIVLEWEGRWSQVASLFLYQLCTTCILKCKSFNYICCLSVCLSVCVLPACTQYSNWEEWRSLRTKSNKQIVPRRVLEFTPLINAVTEDLIQHMRVSRGLDNSVEDVMAPLMNWSFEGVGSCRW